MNTLPGRRGEIADACTVIIDAIESDGAPIYTLIADLEAWYLESRADGYPRRASGAEPGHGRTNITHEFDNPDGSTEELPVAVPTDPTGELVAGRDDDPVYDALVIAHSEIMSARAAMVNARNRIITALHPPEQLDTQREEARSREWCWSCLRVEVPGGGRLMVPVHRDRDRNGIKTPLCRNCYDWCATHLEVFPLREICVVWDTPGQKLTTKRLAEIEAAHVPKPKKKRRRAS